MAQQWTIQKNDIKTKQKTLQLTTCASLGSIINYNKKENHLLKLEQTFTFGKYNMHILQQIQYTITEETIHITSASST